MHKPRALLALLIMLAASVLCAQTADTPTRPPCQVEISYPSTTSARVSWHPDPEDSNIKHYELDFNGSRPLIITTTTFYLFTGLTPGKGKTVKIRAIHNDDSAGSWSNYCNMMTPSTLERRTLYVDKTLAAPVTDGTYDVSPTDDLTPGNAYRSIKAAMLAMNGGDIVVLRGGLYQEGHISIDHRKDGTPDRWSVLMSYPGEWAVIDGQNGGGTGGDDGVVVGAVVDGKTKHSIIGSYMGSDEKYSLALRYWKFERLEIKNGASADKLVARAVYLNGGPFIFRYCYIHDNASTAESFMGGGLNGCAWQDSIVEYCVFERNGVKGSDGSFGGSGFHDSGHIATCSDYNWRNISRDGFAVWEPRDAHSMRNKFRYNYFGEGAGAVKLKSTQYLSGRNPSEGQGYSDAFSDYGDSIHHNIVDGPFHGFLINQDFPQIHNNILIDCYIRAGEFNEIGPYKAAIYNNTIINGFVHINHAIYDASVPYELVGHGYLFNNIMDSGIDNWQSSELSAWHPKDFTTAQMSGYKFDRDYFYRPQQNSSDPDGTRVILLGNGESARYTVATFEAAHPGVDLFRNEVDAADPLYAGTAGASAFLTRGAHRVEGSKTIATAGLGGAHPYLSGVTLPTYIGATNPNDNAWVEGVMNLGVLDSNGIPTRLRDAPAGDPAWIEGGSMPPNHAPVLAPVGSRSIPAGQQIQFTVQGTDADGNPLQYSATGEQ